MKRVGATLLAAVLAAGCGPESTPAGADAVDARKTVRAEAAPTPEHPTTSTDMIDPITKTDAEWRAALSPEQYRVLRKHGTEPAFTGEYWNTKEPGSYLCAGCGLELFRSEHKFDSGTGWPSYGQPAVAEHVGTKEDRTLFMRRVEAYCARCRGHLGHVFEDGPAPTGLRYCINSAALKFEAARKP